MKHKEKNQADEYQRLINDTVRQLKSGLPCYAFKKQQVDAILRKYKKKIGLKIKVENVDDYFVITPEQPAAKYTYY